MSWLTNLLSGGKKSKKVNRNRNRKGRSQSKNSLRKSRSKSLSKRNRSRSKVKKGGSDWSLAKKTQLQNQQKGGWGYNYLINKDEQKGGGWGRRVIDLEE